MWAASTAEICDVDDPFAVTGQGCNLRGLRAKYSCSSAMGVEHAGDYASVVLFDFVRDARLQLVLVELARHINAVAEMRRGLHDIRLRQNRKQRFRALRAREVLLRAFELDPAGPTQRDIPAFQAYRRTLGRQQHMLFGYDVHLGVDAGHSDCLIGGQRCLGRLALAAEFSAGGVQMQAACFAIGEQANAAGSRVIQVPLYDE